MEIQTRNLLEGQEVDITFNKDENLAMLAAGGYILRDIKEAINIGRAELGEQPVEKGFALARLRREWSSEQHTYTIIFSREEEKALLAAGRAAGCTNLKSVIYGVIDDAIGRGCSRLRMIEDIKFDLDQLNIMDPIIASTGQIREVYGAKL